jgi:hypothetical protein
MVLSNPQLDPIFERAAGLVASRMVTVFDWTVYGRVGLVESSTGNGVQYGISQTADGLLSCECPHFTSGRAPVADNGQPVCKHLMAYLLVSEHATGNGQLDQFGRN